MPTAPLSAIHTAKEEENLIHASVVPPPPPSTQGPQPTPGASDFGSTDETRH